MGAIVVVKWELGGRGNGLQRSFIFLLVLLARLALPRRRSNRSGMGISTGRTSLQAPQREEAFGRSASSGKRPGFFLRDDFPNADEGAAGDGLGGVGVGRP